MANKRVLTDEQVQARKDYQKAWREANKEKLAEWNKEYRKRNPDLNKEYLKRYRERHPEKTKASTKKYKDANKEKVKIARDNYKDRKNELNKIRRATDPLWKMKVNLRTSILKSFSRINVRKDNKTVDILGCTYEEFKQYLESKFEPWMDWENHGKYNGTECFGWDVDHIVPVSTAVTNQDVIRLNHHTNLQPLCSYINRDIKRNNPM